jgi:hypothetical protein
VAALGLLPARHRADMRAVALSVLGFGSDAVQDASLAALSRIGDLRERGAFAEIVADRWTPDAASVAGSTSSCPRSWNS